VDWQDFSDGTEVAAKKVKAASKGKKAAPVVKGAKKGGKK
jgi:hypothetical protein